MNLFSLADFFLSDLILKCVILVRTLLSLLDWISRGTEGRPTCLPVKVALGSHFLLSFPRERALNLELVSGQMFAFNHELEKNIQMS